MLAREATVEFAAIVDDWLDVRASSPGRARRGTHRATVDQDVEALCEIVETRGALALGSGSVQQTSRLASATGRSVVVIHPHGVARGGDDRQRLVGAIADVAEAGARLAGVIEIGEIEQTDAVAPETTSRGHRNDTSCPDHAATVAIQARIVALATRASARVDRLQFDDARRSLEALDVAAAELDRPHPVAATRLELARCLFWQGEMARSLRAADAAPRTRRRAYDARAVRRRILALVALGRTADAGRLLPTLERMAVGELAPLWYESSIHWRSASGARSGAHTEFLRGLRLSRLRPDWQVRLALAWDRAAATLDEPRHPEVLDLLFRRHRSTLSPLLVWRLCSALGRSNRRTVSRRPRAGVAVLAGQCDVLKGASERAALDDVLHVLAIVEREDDEVRALEGIAGHVCERLGVMALTLIDARDSQTLLAIGNAGEDIRRAASDAFRQGASTGVVRQGLALVAGVPVAHRGRPIAAFGVRWSLQTNRDLADAIAILTAIAVACAAVVHAAVERRAVATPRESTIDLGLIGDGEAMTRLREEIRRAAAAPFHVLVDGESGSGKELVARSMHRLGPRRQRRLCAVNCAALNDDLLEAELFGHARGAFTGAVAERAGLFEEADGGTLFLDEIGELSARGQAKVLRAIQEQEVRRVGESHPRRVDVRIIAATNRDLVCEAREGRFRDDLRYRLDVVHVRVPPLRERLDDIAGLAGHFWREATARVGSRARLDQATVAALARYDWPGNVRELQNVVASLAVSAPRSGRIGPAWLPPGITSSRFGGVTLEQARRRFDADYVRAALARAGGRRLVAARELGVSRQGLAKLMARLGVDGPPVDRRLERRWNRADAGTTYARLACDRAEPPPFGSPER